MFLQSAKTFTAAHPVSFPTNLPARTGLLAELDRKMARVSKAIAKARPNCPEHLYSIDTDKMDAARRLDG